VIGAMTPTLDDDAFRSLVNSVRPHWRDGRLRPAEEARRLRADPGAFADFLDRLLAGRPTWFLILDQMEEIFAAEAAAYRDAVRLLVCDARKGTPTVEVAHEALLREWPRLADWIRTQREALIRRDEVLRDAARWDARGRPDHLLPYPELVAEVRSRLAAAGLWEDLRREGRVAYFLARDDPADLYDLTLREWRRSGEGGGPAALPLLLCLTAPGRTWATTRALGEWIGGQAPTLAAWLKSGLTEVLRLLGQVDALLLLLRGLVQCPPQPGLDQGGFAATGGTGDHQQIASGQVAQALEQRLGLRLAAEEEPGTRSVAAPVVGEQARIGAEGGGRRHLAAERGAQAADQRPDSRIDVVFAPSDLGEQGAAGMAVVHGPRGEKGEPLGELAGHRAGFALPSEAGGGVITQGGLHEGPAVLDHLPTGEGHQEVSQDQVGSVPGALVDDRCASSRGGRKLRSRGGIACRGLPRLRPFDPPDQPVKPGLVVPVLTLAQIDPGPDGEALW
jgi:hypothetical protein